MANEIKELSKFCNDPKYREKVIARIHKDMDKEYNQRIKTIEAQKNALIVNRNKEISRISKSRWESYARNLLLINRTEGTISINNNIYYFNNINGAQINMVPGYRVVSTETATTKGRKHASIGGAIVGGMIAGPVGAVVGGSALGKTKTKTRGTVVTNQIPTCMHLGVVVNLNGFANEILLITQQVDQSSSVFIKAYQEAQNIVAVLSSLAATPVPQSFLRPEDEQSVKLLDAQINDKQRELEVARANVPIYTLPAMYRTAEQRYMSDDEYLQFLRAADSQRTAQSQVASYQQPVPVQDAAFATYPMGQQVYDAGRIVEASRATVITEQKPTSVFGNVMGWIVSSVLFVLFIVFLLLFIVPQQKYVVAVAIVTLIVISLQIMLINPIFSKAIPSKSVFRWIKRHRIAVAAMLVGVWLSSIFMFALVFPSNTEKEEPAQIANTEETSSTQTDRATETSSEAETSLVRFQKDGFDDTTNKTLTIGSYIFRLPAYFINGSYSNANKSYDAEAESGEQSVIFSIELLSGSYSYDSLNANKEAIFINLKNSLNDSGVEFSSARFSDYNSKLGKGLMAERVATIKSNGTRAYTRYVFIPVNDGCLVFYLLQSDQSEWIYTNDFEKIVNSVEIKKPTPTKKPSSKKTSKKSSKKSSKKTTKKRK